MGKYKKVPAYWWDFKWVGKNIKSIIVESNHEKYPILAEYPIRGAYAIEEIACAEKLISDLTAGRISPKNLVVDK